MITVCIGDGLGNQMFQYAFYLSMKKRYKSETVNVDIFNFYGSCNNHNGYELERVFNLHPERCSKRGAILLADYYPLNFRKHPILNTFFAIKSALFGRKQSFIIQDNATEYYDEVYELDRLHSYMLRGNWVNEKYFHDIRDEVVSAFNFPEITDKHNLEIEESIRLRESVGIHVRRGDYIHNGYNLSDEYYINAVKEIEVRLKGKLVFFVFSDDIDYCKSLFGSDDRFVYVNNNHGNDSFRDMQLMSLCKHNIIANSTFSFWGAYLNRNNNKIVIAPKYSMGKRQNPYACEGWILL